MASTDALGNTTTYGYPTGQDKRPGAVPSQITEPLSRSTSITLDAKGNLAQLAVAGPPTTYTYDPQGRRSAETDPLGATTT